MDQRVAFVGGGNMGRAMIGGLIARGYACDRLRVAEPREALRAALARDYQVTAVASNLEAIDGADIVVLAVKPQIVREVAGEIAAAARRQRPLVLSIAAGIETAHLRAWLGADVPLVRVMPNTPALIGLGAAALYAAPGVGAEHRQAAQAIMEAVGIAIWVDQETQIDVVTALSGSGPAYHFLILEMLEAGAVELGLPAATARRLAIETAYGAAALARASACDPRTLREQVTSPGGTTERAIEVLRAGGLAPLLSTALAAAHRRAGELAGEFGRAR